jgi:hypothetical protein
LDKFFALNPQWVSKANTTYMIRTTLRMIVAIPATSMMPKAGLATCHRWRQASDGIDVDQPFWHTLGMVFSAATSSTWRSELSAPDRAGRKAGEHLPARPCAPITGLVIIAVGGRATAAAARPDKAPASASVGALPSHRRFRQRGSIEADRNQSGE